VAPHQGAERGLISVFPEALKQLGVGSLGVVTGRQVVEVPEHGGKLRVGHDGLPIQFPYRI
jgi:hypothetical protein